MVRISIIVPVYNVEGLLPRCVESILAQSVECFELLLVDDGSTDGSASVCDRYAAADSRVRVIRKSNGGVSTARNRGLEGATGHYICFVDSDDWVEESYLCDFGVDEYRADIYISGATYDIDNHTYSHKVYEATFVEGAKYISAEFSRQGVWSNGYPWGKLYRADIIERYSIRFDEELSIHEDHLFLFEYYTHIESARLAHSAGYHYLVVDCSNRKLSDRVCGYEELLRASEAFGAVTESLRNHFSLSDVQFGELRDVYFYGCRQRALRGLFVCEGVGRYRKFVAEVEYWRGVGGQRRGFYGAMIMLMLRLRPIALSYVVVGLCLKIRERRPRNVVRLIKRDLDGRSTCVNLSMKKIVVSHPTANANVRGAVAGFCHQGVLHSFHTSVSCFRGSILYLLSKFPPFVEFRKRSFIEPLRGYTHTYPFVELGRMVATKLNIGRWLTHERGRFCIDNVYRYVDRCVAKFVEHRGADIDAAYCYEDCAVETFEAAHKLGKKTIYDLPIGYWRTMHKLLDEERANRPEWAVTLGGFDDSDAKLMRKDLELALADKIYVASTFTQTTLRDYPGVLADVEVIPYGFPAVNDSRVFEPFEGRKIKLLFVGGLSQRKGIAYIFEAIEGLEDRVELMVVGRGDLANCKVLRDALRWVTYLPSLPHDEVLKMMSTRDLLLFPSLFEGFGLVVTEAMSQGMPVVTTLRTCGADVITHGRNGWIVEAGSSESLRAQIVALVQNPQRITDAGRRAIETAKQRPWSLYESELAESVIKYLRGV